MYPDAVSSTCFTVWEYFWDSLHTAERGKNQVGDKKCTGAGRVAKTTLLAQLN